MLCTGMVDIWWKCQLCYTCRVSQDLIHISNTSWKGADLLCKHVLSCHVVGGLAKHAPTIAQPPPLFRACVQDEKIKPNAEGRCHTDLNRPRKSTRLRSCVSRNTGMRGLLVPVREVSTEGALRF